MNRVVDEVTKLYREIVIEKKKRLNRDIIPLILVFLLIFQNVLQTYFSLFQYYDEFFVILCALCLPKVVKEKEIILTKLDKMIIISNIAIIVVGLLGNLFYGYQNFVYIIQDVIIYIKFFTAFYYVRFAFSNYRFTTNKKMYKLIKYVTIFFVVLTLFGYLFSIFPYEIRYGIKSNQLFFSHPTFLSAVCAFIFVVVAMSKVLTEKDKMLLMGTLLFLIVSTLRSKAFVFAFLAVIIYYLIIIKNEKINMKIILISAILSGIICFNQIRFYFFNESDVTARSALITTSIKIASDHFPFGSGFGTFGSHASKVNYSPIYGKYNIDNVWGLSQLDGGAFISDNFWPMILGQFGYIGFIAYVLIVICLFTLIQRQYSKSGFNYIYYSGIMSLMYLLISSTSESAFVNPLSIMFALVMGYCISDNREKNRR